jgi:hypothetical protein
VARIEADEDLALRLELVPTQNSVWRPLLERLGASFAERNPCLAADGEVCLRDVDQEPLGRTRLSAELMSLSHGDLRIVYQKENVRRARRAQLAKSRPQAGRSTAEVVKHLESLVD